MRIGVISDTHGLLRPEAIEALDGCELIVHAGDIGKVEVLEALQSIAPLQVVRGNNDLRLPWATELADLLCFELDGYQTVLVHDVADVPANLDDRVRVVISGHSHKAAIQWRGGRLFLNPGSAGPRRFRLPVTVAILETGRHGLAARIVPLLE